MRAIRGAFQNARGTTYIRNGKDKTIVDIEFSDGHSLRWEKGRSKASKPTYVVDKGKEIHPGQGVPTEVEVLGVRPIQAGGMDIWPQFAPQITGQMFLIDQPGSILAEAVADVDRVTQLNEALRSAESDRRAVNAELKVRLGDRDAQAQELARFDGLEQVEKAVEAIEKGHRQAAKEEKALTGLRDLKARLEAAEGATKRLAGVEAIAVPDSREAEDLLARLGVARALQERLGLARGRVTQYAPVGKIGVPEAQEALRSLDALEVARGLADRLARAQEKVAKFASFSGISEAEVDLEPLSKILAAWGVVRDLKTRADRATNGVSEQEQALAEAEVACEAAEREFTKTLAEVGACPLCGSLVGQTHGAHL